MEISDKTYYKILYSTISILCIITAIIARLCNPGWMIFIFGILGPMHAILFLVSNFMISRQANKTLLAKIMFCLSCLTFTTAYVLYPDFSDVDGYAFFATISNQSPLYNIVSIISSWCFIFNIIIVILGFFTEKFVKNPDLAYSKNEADTSNYNEKKIKDKIYDSNYKEYSYLKITSIIILIFNIISLIGCFFYGTTKGILFYLISAILIILTIVLSNKKNIYSLYFGIISSLVLLFSPGIIYKIISIILIILCIKAIFTSNKQ